VPLLEEVRRDAWKLARATVTQDIAAILKRYEAAASTKPEAALGDVLAALRTHEQEFKRARIGSPTAQQALLADVQTTATFLEVRRSQRSYTGKFQVVSARVEGNNLAPVERGLMWNVGGLNATKDPIVLEATPGSGEKGFLTIRFTTSANGCGRPNGPTRLGP